MAEATNVSYGEILLSVLKDSKINSSNVNLDDYWYAPIEKRQNQVIEESVTRGMQYLMKKAA